MSNTEVKHKNVRRKGNATLDGWILLAEDAERDAARARERSEQLSQAARIFRKNAEGGVPFPVDIATQISDTTQIWGKEFPGVSSRRCIGNSSFYARSHRTGMFNPSVVAVLLLVDGLKIELFGYLVSYS
jgi:hypothetical protein